MSCTCQLGFRGLQKWVSIFSWKLQTLSHPRGPSGFSMSLGDFHISEPRISPPQCTASEDHKNFMNSIFCLLPFFCPLPLPVPQSQKKNRRMVRLTIDGGLLGCVPDGLPGSPSECSLLSLFNDQIDGQEPGATAAAILINQL